MLYFSKKLSIIIFQRVFEKYPFILIASKIFFFKYAKSNNLKVFSLKKYILAHSYDFKFFNINLTNLLLILFFNKFEFLKHLQSHFYKIFSVKYKHFFFTPYFFIKKTYYLFFFSLKTFFFKLKSIFLFLYLHLFSFLRFCKKQL